MRVPERNGRGKGAGSGEEDVTACTATDGQLRGVIWGDMQCHAMAEYARRVERLTFKRLTGKG